MRACPPPSPRVYARGSHNADRLLAPIAEAPAAARPALDLLAEQLRQTWDRIEAVTDRIAAAQKRDPLARRLATIPGIGTLSSSAFAATTPEVANFETGRDDAASCQRHACGVTPGLTPQPHSSGGQERLGRISKAGNRYLRRLLYLGAMAQNEPSCRHAFETDGERQQVRPGPSSRRRMERGWRLADLLAVPAG